MSKTYISASLRRMVFDRADGKCEYCLIPEALANRCGDGGDLGADCCGSGYGSIVTDESSRLFSGTAVVIAGWSSRLEDDRIWMRDDRLSFCWGLGGVEGRSVESG